MKKIYQMPTVKWMEAETAEMIAASVIENGFSLEAAPETEAVSGNLSRQTSVWGEDED